MLGAARTGKKAVLGINRITGRKTHSVHDEMIAAPRTERGRWATAFEIVLKVGYDFYRSKPDSAQRRLEEQFTEAAKNDSAKGRKGKHTVTGRVATSHIRKAAKVVAKRVAYALEADDSAYMLRDDLMDKLMSGVGSVTGRSIYHTTLMQNIPKAIKTGSS